MEKLDTPKYYGELPVLKANPTSKKPGNAKSLRFLWILIICAGCLAWGSRLLSEISGRVSTELLILRDFAQLLIAPLRKLQLLSVV